MPSLILKEVILTINVICNCARCNCLQTGLCFSVIIQNSVPSPFNSLQPSTLASHWPLLFLSSFLVPKCFIDFHFHYVYSEDYNWRVCGDPGMILSTYVARAHKLITAYRPCQTRPGKLKDGIQFPLCVLISMLQKKFKILCITFQSSVLVICVCPVRCVFRMLLKLFVLLG